MRCLGLSGSRKNLRQSLRSFGAPLGTVYMYHLHYEASTQFNDHKALYDYNGHQSGVLALYAYNVAGAIFPEDLQMIAVLRQDRRTYRLSIVVQMIGRFFSRTLI